MNGHEPPDVSREFVKVLVNLEPCDSHDYATESLWSEPLSEGHYRLANVPFYAYGLGYGDIVVAEVRESQRVITTVAHRSGHSTYRILLSETALPEDGWLANWGPLERAGCAFERASARLLAIDVPPEADIHEAYRLLEVGERAGVWTFEEGHCGHSL